MLVQQMGESQPANECQSGCVFIVVVYLGQLILKVANVCLEAIGGPHLDGEEMMVILLELLAGGILSEEQLGEIIKVVD